MLLSDPSLPLFAKHDEGCQRCGAPLYQGKKFCSHECYHASKGPDETGKRVCRDCGKKYSVGSPKLDRNANWCVDCRNAWYRAWNKRNANKQRARHLRQTRAMTTQEYDALLEAQQGVCAICLRPPKTKALAVDHDHATGAIRGLLCFSCNAALGKFQDDVSRLHRAINYLDR